MQSPLFSRRKAMTRKTNFAQVARFVNRYFSEVSPTRCKRPAKPKMTFTHNPLKHLRPFVLSNRQNLKFKKSLSPDGTLFELRSLGSKPLLAGFSRGFAGIFRATESVGNRVFTAKIAGSLVYKPNVEFSAKIAMFAG